MQYIWAYFNLVRHVLVTYQSTDAHALSDTHMRLECVEVAIFFSPGHFLYTKSFLFALLNHKLKWINLW